MAFKIRRQRPVKGGRAPLPSCVLKDIRREVEATARKFRVSRSFVIATALGEAFGVETEKYYTVEKRTKLRLVR